MNESSNRKKIYKVLILVTILAVPGFLYYLLQEKGKNRYRPLPIFGAKTVASTFHSVRGKQVPDTIYHHIADFDLKNQSGNSVTLNTLKGKVVVLNLFYTNVQSGGAKASLKAMEGFSKLYTKNQMVHLVSLSVDPLDGQTELAKYANTINAKSQKWDLIAGDSTVVSELIKQSLLLDAVNESTSLERKFIYSNKMVLLDSDHKIRGFYDSSSQEELSKLDDEIKVLIAEELRNIKDGR